MQAEAYALWGVVVRVASDPLAASGVDPAACRLACDICGLGPAEDCRDPDPEPGMVRDAAESLVLLYSCAVLVGNALAGPEALLQPPADDSPGAGWAASLDGRLERGLRLLTYPPLDEYDPRTNVVGWWVRDTAQIDVLVAQGAPICPDRASLLLPSVPARLPGESDAYLGLPLCRSLCHLSHVYCGLLEPALLVGLTGRALAPARLRWAVWGARAAGRLLAPMAEALASWLRVSRCDGLTD